MASSHAGVFTVYTTYSFYCKEILHFHRAYMVENLYAWLGLVALQKASDMTSEYENQLALQVNVHFIELTAGCSM